MFVPPFWHLSKYLNTWNQRVNISSNLWGIRFSVELNFGLTAWDENYRVDCQASVFELWQKGWIIRMVNSRLCNTVRKNLRTRLKHFLSTPSLKLYFWKIRAGDLKRRKFRGISTNKLKLDRMTINANGSYSGSPQIYCFVLFYCLNRLA